MTNNVSKEEGKIGGHLWVSKLLTSGRGVKDIIRIYRLHLMLRKGLIFHPLYNSVLYISYRLVLKLYECNSICYGIYMYWTRGIKCNCTSLSHKQDVINPFKVNDERTLLMKTIAHIENCNVKEMKFNF